MVKGNTILVLVLLTFTFLPFTFASDAGYAQEAPANGPEIRIKAEPGFGAAPLTVSFDANEFQYHYG